MPWTPEQFHARHNHHLTPEQTAHAAAIADAILRRGGHEGLAIATANRRVEHPGGIMHRDDGGSVDPSIGGVTPSAQSANPLMQGMIQRYSSMTPEQLQQLAVQMGGSQQGQLIQKILQQKRVMSAQQPQQSTQQRQAAPTQQGGSPTQQGAQSQQPQQPVSPLIPSAGQMPMQARGGGIMQHRDMGGAMSMSPSTESPWWTRSESRGPASGGASGFLQGSTPGRADAIKTTAPAGAYVLPADVVAGLGEGNSLAGARAVQEMLSTGPHGTPLPRGASGHSIPRPPPAYGARARGGVSAAPGYGFVSKPRNWSGPRLYRAGGEPNNTPVALSHGEFVISPHDVQRFGAGDHKKGIAHFDKFVVEQRKKHIKKLQSLPGPVKS